MKLFKLKNSGYLMIDAIVGIAIGSLLSITIITMFTRYYKLKVINSINIESLESFNNVCLEIYHNMSYEEGQSLIKDKEYYIDIEAVKNIKILVSNNISNLLTTESKLSNEYCIIRKLYGIDESILDIEVRYYKKHGIFEYKNKEVIRKYDFII